MTTFTKGDIVTSPELKGDGDFTFHRFLTLAEMCEYPHADCIVRHPNKSGCATVRAGYCNSDELATLEGLS